jgi:hypothetical protein
VLIGSLVFLVQHADDFRDGFRQPLSLALVTGIQFAESSEKQNVHNGSTNPEDELAVQVVRVNNPIVIQMCSVVRVNTPMAVQIFSVIQVFTLTLSIVHPARMINRINQR